MKGIIRKITIFNLAFVPFLITVTVIIVSIIDSLPKKYETDSFFTENDAYSILVIFLAIITFFIWGLFTLIFAVYNRKNKKVFTQNLIALLWLPISLLIIIIVNEINDRSHYSGFLKKINEQSVKTKYTSTPIPSGNPVLLSYIHNNNFYIICGHQLEFEERECDAYYEATKLYFNVDAHVPDYSEVNNIEIFLLQDGKLIAQDLNKHPLIESEYQKNYFDYDYRKLPLVKDSLEYKVIELKPYQMGCLFPIHINRKDYLMNLCENEHKVTFEGVFDIQQANRLKSYEPDRLYESEDQKERYKKGAFKYQNLYYSNRNNDFMGIVNPDPIRNSEHKAYSDFRNKSPDKYSLFIGYKSNEIEKVYHIDRLKNYPIVKGIFFENNKAYLVERNRLIEFDL